MKTHQLISLSSLFILLSLSGCGDDEIEPIVEEQVYPNITTMNLTFTNEDDPNDINSGSYSDFDGTGNNPATIVNPKLKIETFYTFNVTLLDESTNPPQNINSEIITNGHLYQVIFVRDGLELGFSIEDADRDGKVLGLTGESYASLPSSGEVTITVKYKPSKNFSGIPTPALLGGRTIFEGTFNITVE